MGRGTTMLVAMAALACGPATASAATFTVTGTGDPASASCSGGVCDSLRAAVKEAGRPTNVGSTVQLGAATYVLGGGAGQASGPLTIPIDMTVQGAGPETTIQQTDAGVGVVEIANSTATVAISDLTITGGQAAGTTAPAGVYPSPGPTGGLAVGGILDAGVLTLTRVAVRGNTARGGAGGVTLYSAPGGAGGAAAGGIAVLGRLTLISSSVTGNTATGGHGGRGATIGNGGPGGAGIGGIWVAPSGGRLVVSNSVVTGNQATGGGGGSSGGGYGNTCGAGGAAIGGILVEATQPVDVAASAVSSNVAVGGSGGSDLMGPFGGVGGTATGGLRLAAATTATIQDAALVGNTATGGAGGAAIGRGGNGGPAFGGALAATSGGTLTVRRATLGLSSVTGGAGGGTTTLSGATPGVGGIGSGGGAYLAATTTIVNTTIAANAAGGGAGGPDGGGGSAPGAGGGGPGGGVSVVSPGTLTLASDTLTANASTGLAPSVGVGANLFVGGVAARARATIFGSPGTGPNCSIVGGGFVDDGQNLSASGGATCQLTDPTDLVDVDPQLGSLGDHGGLGPTVVPAATSPARGASGACVDPSQAGAPALTVDQRGQPRSGACDIGAVQTQAPRTSDTPSIGDVARNGQVLTCSLPALTGDGTFSFTYTWLRNGTPIPGANGPTYSPTSADVAQTVSCVVVAVSAYGSLTLSSAGLVVAPAPSTAGGSPPPRLSPAPFLGVTLASRTLKPRNTRLTVKIACPATAPGGACAVRVGVYGKTGRLPAAAAASKPKAKKKAPPATRLASGRLTIKAGKTATASLKLTPAGRTASRRASRTVRVLLTATAGATTVTTNPEATLAKAK